MDEYVSDRVFVSYVGPDGLGMRCGRRGLNSDSED